MNARIQTAVDIIFEQLPQRRGQARFMVKDENGAWQPVLWEEFAGQIRKAALGLSQLGIQPGDRVTLFAANRWEWAAAAYATQAIGAVLVPVYPGSTAEQLGHVLTHSDAKAVIVDGQPLVDLLPRAECRSPALQHIILLDDGLTLNDPRSGYWNALLAQGDALDRQQTQLFKQLSQVVDLHDTALMLYTSGTSGLPKGVPLSHWNIGTNGHDWFDVLGEQPDPEGIDLLWLPMSHIFGFGELGVGNRIGYTSYLCNPMEVLQLLPDIRPSVLMSVPAYWEKIAIAARAVPAEQQTQEFARLTGGRLKFCLSGGAGLKLDIKEFFLKQGVLIIEGYGLTECSPTLTLNRPDDFNFNSVGKPLPSVQLRLADDGEILAKGPNVFSGYHKDPKASEAAFDDDGWFHTGDIGQLDEQGFLRIVDRKKDILVTANGKNIPPSNIEMHFRDDAYIEHLLVYGDGHKYLVAGIWLNATAQALPEEQIEQHLQHRIAEVNQTLARFETIKRYRVMQTPLSVEAGLLTAALKIRRKQIYREFEEAFEALYEEVLGEA